MSEISEISEIQRGLSLLYEAGDIVELRAFQKVFNYPNPRTISGFFNNLGLLSEAIHEVNTHTRKNGNPALITVYTTLNPIRLSWQTVNNQVYWGSSALKKELHAQGINDSPRLNPGHSIRTTSNDDILFRRWVLVDVDAGQPKNQNSNALEKAQTIELADRVIYFLANRGIPMPVVADSGNGTHLLLRVNLPNTAEVTSVIRRFLAALDLRFTDRYGSARIDLTVFTAGRITKAYGSLVYKGAPTPRRPCRRSGIISSPDTDTLTTLEQLSTLADEFAPADLPVYAEIDQLAIDQQVKKLIEYLDRNKIDHPKPVDMGGWIVVPISCPNEDEHSNDAESAFVSVSQNGALGFKCHHDHCIHLRWSDFCRLLKSDFIPQAYFSQPSQPQASQSQPSQPENIMAVGVPIKPHERAKILLDELLPIGSRCLLATIWNAAAARGISKRAIQRLHQRLNIHGINVDGQAWLERGERVAGAAQPAQPVQPQTRRGRPRGRNAGTTQRH